MSTEIVVTPAEAEYRSVESLDALPAHVRADLEALCDEINARFPEADAVGETGALSERAAIEVLGEDWIDGPGKGVGVVIRPEVITRPLVLNSVMRLAAPRQLLATAPRLAVLADPRWRIDIDVHRRPTVAGAAITDHAVRGRPFGTLPWVTREMLGFLIGELEVDGDRLELDADDERWFLYERVSGQLEVSVADGPGVPVRNRTLSFLDLGTAADAGWAWARSDGDWPAFFGGLLGDTAA